MWGVYLFGLPGQAAAFSLRGVYLAHSLWDSSLLVCLWPARARCGMRHCLHSAPPPPPLMASPHQAQFFEQGEGACERHMFCAPNKPHMLAVTATPVCFPRDRLGGAM